MKVILVYIGVIFLCVDVRAQERIFEPFPDSLHQNRLYLVVAQEALFLGGYHYLSHQLYYKEANSRSFHFKNDAKNYLYIDKASNAFASYQESYNVYYALRRAGLDEQKAFWYGGLSGLFFQTYMEVVDGFYEEYGFSSSDMLSNLFGTVLFMGQQKMLDEQPLKIKFSFSPSKVSQSLVENGWEALFKDFSAQTYWFSVNANKLFLKQKLPDWFNLAVGYSTSGVFNSPSGSLSGSLDETLENERGGEYLFSFDVDFSKINTKSKFLKSFLRIVNFIKFPFPALYLNDNGNIRLIGLYF